MKVTKHKMITVESEVRELNGLEAEVVVKTLESGKNYLCVMGHSVHTMVVSNRALDELAQCIQKFQELKAADED